MNCYQQRIFYMRNLFIFLILIGFTIFSSCKKCITCEIKFRSASGATSVRVMDDCARRGKKIDEFEDMAKEVADSLSGTVVCVTE